MEQKDGESGVGAPEIHNTPEPPPVPTTSLGGTHRNILVDPTKGNHNYPNPMSVRPGSTADSSKRLDRK